MAISNLMELLTIRTSPTPFIHEADDIHDHFCGRKLNEQLRLYQKVMAQRNRVSDIHQLCNDEGNETASPKSPASDQPPPPPPLLSRRQLPLPPFENLHLPRLPGVREMEQGIKSIHDDEVESVSQPAASMAPSPTDHTTVSPAVLPPRESAISRIRPSHQRMLSDPQVHGIRSNQTTGRFYPGIAASVTTSNRIGGPSRAWQHSRSESSSSNYTPAYHHARSDSVPERSMPVYAHSHSRNDSATDFHQPGSYLSGHPSLPASHQPYPSPPATGSSYGSSYPPPFPAFHSFTGAPSVTSNVAAHGIPPSLPVVPSVGSSTHGHHHSHSTSSLLSSKKRRGNLPKQAVRILKRWVEEHKDNPYPNEEEKTNFCRETGLSTQQINNWFINARRRNLTQEERDRMRRIRAEASGSQTSGSRPNSAHSNQAAPDFGGFDHRRMGEGPHDS